ncbi:MAG: glycosyltransferase [Aeromicrobium sp.]
MNDRGASHVLTVAILTYLRGEQLGLLLGVVDDLLADVHDFTTEILVVDNDPAGSAEAVVNGAITDRVRYVNETTPGIAAARRRALAETRDSALLMFLDDDLEPSRPWLEPMISLWRSTQAAAVVGHVDYYFESAVDPWVVEGGFFRRAVHPHGARLAVAGAGNLLLDRQRVAALGVDFDPTLGLSGGEDTLFTRQLSDRGGLIVFCPGSVVRGLVPADRTVRAQALTRARAHGGIGVRVELAGAPSLRRSVAVRLRAVLGGAARVVVGTLRGLAGVVAKDLSHQARGARLAARGQGMIDAGLGRYTEEYARD